MSSPVPLLTLEAQIKRRLRDHLRLLGFRRDGVGNILAPMESKEAIRFLHEAQRIERLRCAASFVDSRWPILCKYFANGTDIEPSRINPILEAVKAETWQSDLFRLASLSWSIPVSQGFGRRMRFLVWDEYCEKLIGLIALGDPVFNLRVRDEMIGWNASMRKDRLVHIMDAFVLGALPPYNMLLAGKMVACLVRTREVLGEFSTRYANSKGIISRKEKHPSLVLVTTSSALGRSSVYNRLVLNRTRFFRSIGYTSGWGHFHIPDDLFELMRKLLAEKNHAYARNHRFGDGPNWRLRAIREVLGLLGLNPNLLRHGIAREVFVSELATNAVQFLTGEASAPCYDGLETVTEVGAAARGRWIERRALRSPEIKAWQATAMRGMLTAGASRGSATSKEMAGRSR